MVVDRNHLMVTSIRGLVVMIALTDLGACASINGYQKSPEPSSVVKARHTKYYGANSDDGYYAASGDARQTLRDQLVYGKMQVLEDDFLDFERSLNSAVTMCPSVVISQYWF